MIKHRKPNDIIKKELNKQRVTQTQAAYDLNLNRSTFSLICGGYLTPKPETRAKIAAYLGMPEKHLFSQLERD
jgi:transcriptional regulator with XRE-family HTH domain